MIALDEARVGDHEAAAVQHVVADQAVEEPLYLGTEGIRLGGQLVHRLGEAVGALHVAAAQGAEQLGLVVALYAERGAFLDHAHDQAEDAGRVRAPVHQVAEEHRAAAGVAGADRPARLVAVDGVAEL